MKIKFILLLICMQIMLSAYNYFSPLYKLERLNPQQDEVYTLRYENIILNSEKVFNDSVTFLKGKDYLIDHNSRTIQFKTSPGNIMIEYMVYPQDLLQRFFYYKPQDTTDTLAIKTPKDSKNIFSENSRLNITGNKTIAVSVSNTDNFDIDQSLFLKIDGELSREVKIEAQLTDSQSPITPEGDSRQLSSLDKVFLRIYSRQYELAFGDLQMEFSDTKFLNYTPKFEGLRASYHDKDKYVAALAISKGKRFTQTFDGIEAKQGPYYLRVEEKGVQVVPGSESVFLNATEMERGSDYTIDYSEGSITFTDEHFIGSTSYIRVEFQYTDENYRQNMYLASTKNSFWEKFEVQNSLIIQNDDKENPLVESFNETEKAALRSAGDDDIWIDAIYEVEDGAYKLAASGDYYIYVGNDTTQAGNYNISFTDVGFGNGDYQYVSSGDYYEFAGSDQGSYAPIKQLIAPKNKTNYDLAFSYKTGIFEFRTEGLLSYYDQNTFSNQDDEDNMGFAANTQILLAPNYDLLKPELRLNYRKKTSELNTFAEIIDAVDAYEIFTPPDTLSSDEYSTSLNLDLFNFYRPELYYRHRTTDDFSNLDYFSMINRSEQRIFLPALYHRLVKWKEEYEHSRTGTKDFIQNQLNLQYILWNWMLGFDYFHKQLDSDSEEQQQSEEQKVAEYSVSYNTDSRFASRIYYETRDDRFDLATNILEQEYQKTTQTIGHELTINSRKHRIRTNISHREVEDSTSQSFDMASIDLQNTLFKDAVNFNSRYSLKNVEFYPKIREFIYVGEDLGSYDEDSVYVGYNEGDYDWEITAIDYDNPKMSVEVNSNFTLHISPAQFTDSYLERFQTESQLVIMENSKAKNKTNIYLLKPSYLLNENTTLYGKNLFQQIVWWDMITDKLNMRLKFKNEKIMDNRYNEETEIRKNRDSEIKLQLLAVKNMNLELLGMNSQEENNRYDSVVENNSVELEILNRLNRDANLRSAFLISRENGEESDQSNNYEIWSYEIKEILSYFWKTKYRIIANMSFKKNDRKGSEFLGFLQEKRDGNIFKWNINLNYRMNNFTSIKFEYDGESYPRQDTRHEITVEVKAEF